MLEGTSRLDQPLYAVSLFSGAGIGDLGFRAAGMHLLQMCELEENRSALAKLNFPETTVHTADLWQIRDELCEQVITQLQEKNADLFLLSCTAPCQGMSKNGQGTLLRNIRNGERPRLDPRNRLILPGLHVAKTLLPKWIVMENVLEMNNTLIEDEAGNVRPILEIVSEVLSPEYVGQAYEVQFADYGIPQRRQRLITVFTRDPNAQKKFRAGASFIPAPTHAKNAQPPLDQWISVTEALSHFSPLDSLNEQSAQDDRIPFHRVPVLDPKKYEWIRHTPPGRSAFDNQCIHPPCQFQGNPNHRASRNAEGINRASPTTPLYCQRCGELLPRPFVEEDGDRRIMTGYTSAYKRMESDLPSPALTRNLSYPCSDQKLHPHQNRVLSLAEAMELQTITRYEYFWGPLSVQRGKKNRILKNAADSLIRLVIGESVPPFFLELLGAHLRALSLDL